MRIINRYTKSSLGFPSKLSQLAQPPKKLFVAGDLKSALKMPCVAIVGSRKVSKYGRAVTELFASELAREGITIISGLALGVDSIAHHSCLEARGKTIAVLPTPLDQIYPSSHRNLARQIVDDGGVLISEYDTGDFVGRMNFVARNRIIAALADAVLITEAALKSGSLHTARYALELGRDVLAVPGNITSETSEGANNLLKQGAIAATKTSDVLFALGVAPMKNPKPKPARGANEAEQSLIDLIASGVTEGGDLQERSGLEASEFNTILTMLELHGAIRSAGANEWVLL